jgi:hypothetical protein
MSSTATTITTDVNRTLRVENPTKTIDISLNYMKPGYSEKPYFKSNTIAGVFESSNIDHEYYPHKVTDVRGQEDAFYLDKNGFEFAKHSTSEDIIELIRNNNDEQIKKQYYPQIEKFLKERTGADRVFIFDHTVRKRDPRLRRDGRGPVGARQPALRVHIDQWVGLSFGFETCFLIHLFRTPKAGFERVKTHLPEEAEELLKGRSQIIK